MDSIADILGINQNSSLPAYSAPTKDVGAQQDVGALETIKKTETKHSENQIDIEQIKKVIHTIKDQLDGVIRILEGNSSNNASTDAVSQNPLVLSTGERVLEGVFSGEKMIGSDGAEYSMPPNYASKSKLVEGDIMKLTITKTGSFIYKQIKPMERKKIIGILEYDSEKKKWTARHENHNYKVLTASISFYKGKAGDEAIIIVPVSGHADWGAVDNIISI